MTPTLEQPQDKEFDIEEDDEEWLTMILYITNKTISGIAKVSDIKKYGLIKASIIFNRIPRLEWVTSKEKRV
jgi:hypothetical protein